MPIFFMIYYKDMIDLTRFISDLNKDGTLEWKDFDLARQVNI